MYQTYRIVVCTTTIVILSYLVPIIETFLVVVSTKSHSSLVVTSNRIPFGRIPSHDHDDHHYHHGGRYYDRLVSSVVLSNTLSSTNTNDTNTNVEQQQPRKQKTKRKRTRYDLGIRPTTDDNDKRMDATPSYDHVKYLSIPEPVRKSHTSSTSNNVTSSKKSTNVISSNIRSIPSSSVSPNTTSNVYELGIGKNRPKTIGQISKSSTNTTLEEIWNKGNYLYNPNVNTPQLDTNSQSIATTQTIPSSCNKEAEVITYDKIDASIPSSVYSQSENIDLVWDLMKIEARKEADREPLLVSFLFSSILNHKSLESALAFHLANRLSSPHMLSTQVMSLILESLEYSASFRRDMRADILAVRDRDPACTCLPDVFLYFKGFHALQAYRVAHYFYGMGRKVLSHYLQSQVSQSLQIDIHPNATLGRGIMLDHGTGIVIGETAVIGHNCSILHHVTLGGSGRRGVDRHPKIGSNVLIGAGSSVLGNIKVGNGAQIGAGTLVIMDLPSHCVAVGVPARIVGTYAEEVLPSINMNQDFGSDEFKRSMLTFEMESI